VGSCPAVPAAKQLLGLRIERLDRCLAAIRPESPTISGSASKSRSLRRSDTPPKKTDAPPTQAIVPSAPPSPPASTRYGASELYAGVSAKNPSAPRFCGPRGTQSPRSIIRTFLPAITDGQAAMTPPKLLPITIRSYRSPSYFFAGGCLGGGCLAGGAGLGGGAGRYSIVTLLTTATGRPGEL
jgi:hypothetical protein